MNTPLCHFADSRANSAPPDAAITMPAGPAPQVGEQVLQQLREPLRVSVRSMPRPRTARTFTVPSGRGLKPATVSLSSSPAWHVSISSSFLRAGMPSSKFSMAS